MDKLDKLSLLAIVVLIVSTFFLVVVYADDTQSRDRFALQHQVTAFNPELEKKVKTAQGLLENNNLIKARELARVLISEFPYDGTPHMVIGDVELRNQDPVAAMESYRKAVDLNRDYLDKKTEVFQGKKIKATVLEAKVIIEKELATSPGNDDLRGKRKTVYYMLRRIAGSCG